MWGRDPALIQGAFMLLKKDLKGGVKYSIEPYVAAEHTDHLRIGD
jgi:hypothetical protein